MAVRGARSSAGLQAFVLHRYDWSESSLILDLFTREQGRIAVAAKGAKRPYSQLRPVLLPFQRIHVGLGRVTGVEGAADVQNLRSAEWTGGSAMLAGGALFSGFYLNELLMKLVARHDPHPALFDVYAETLHALGEEADLTSEACLRAFELTLLRELGVLPDLSVSTTTQQPVEASTRYTLLADAGIGSARDGDSALAGQAWIDLQAALDHGSLRALQGACAEVLPDLKSLLRSQLHYHLGTSSLRTRQVMVEAQGL